MKNTFIVLLALCLFSCMFSFSAVPSARVEQQKDSDKVIPLGRESEVLFYHLDGTPVAFEELFTSSKTVLFIWTTWCPHCRVELRSLNRNCPVDDEIQFYYIDAREPLARVERKIESMRLGSCITDDILLDRRGYLLYRYRIIGIPTYLFFKDGMPVYRSYFLNDRVLRRAFGNE